MRLVDLNSLNAINQALSDVLGYLGDNSCSDPDCCGGPYYERDDFERGCAVLESYGLKYEEARATRTPIEGNTP